MIYFFEKLFLCRRDPKEKIRVQSIPLIISTVRFIRPNIFVAVSLHRRHQSVSINYGHGVCVSAAVVAGVHIGTITVDTHEK